MGCGKIDQCKKRALCSPWQSTQNEIFHCTNFKVLTYKYIFTMASINMIPSEYNFQVATLLVITASMFWALNIRQALRVWLPVTTELESDISPLLLHLWPKLLKQLLSYNLYLSLPSCKVKQPTNQPIFCSLTY